MRSEWVAKLGKAGLGLSLSPHPHRRDRGLEPGSHGFLAVLEDLVLQEDPVGKGVGSVKPGRFRV